MKNILDRLRAGESADSISQSLADSLNEALKAYEEEKKEEEIKRLKEIKKVELAEQIYSLFCEYYEIKPNEKLKKIFPEILDMILFLL